MKTKFLFSDVGGVLLTNGWGHESRQKASEVFGFDYEPTKHRHDFIFNTWEIGKISLSDYLDVVIFFEPRPFSREEFISFMYEQSVQLPDMLPYMIEWKKQHPEVKVISINNEPRELNQYRIRKYNLHLFFDAFISSCEVGMRKPDPGIFNLAVGIAQAEASECLYFDDRKMLVDSAVKTGLNAHQHTSFEESIQLLNEWVKA